MNEAPNDARARRHAGGRGRLVFVLLVVAVIVGAVAGIETLRQARFTPGAPQPVAERDAARRARDPFPRTLRDANNASITVSAAPQRIASQTLGTDEILLAICDPKRVVAFSNLALDPKYSNVVAEARATNSPAVGNAEDILRLKPDLIFVASYSRAEIVEQLQAAGAPAFHFANFDRIEDVRTNIRSVGYVIGEDERAAQLIQKMDEELARIRARTPPGERRPRVMSYGGSGYTAGANTLFDDIIRHAGAINVSVENDIDGFRKISAEQVLAWQPDYIVIAGNGGDEQMEEARRELLLNPAVAATNAARNNRIVVMDTRHSLTVSHHIVRAVEDLANALYGDAAGRTQ